MEREGQASQRISDGCALHGGEPFTAICRQCGTYMCKRCNEDARFDTCPKCRAEPAQAAPIATELRARAGPSASTGAGTASSTSFPFRRDGVVWGAFLRFCFDTYRKSFGLLTLSWLIFLGATVALQSLGSLLIYGLSDSGTAELLFLPFGLIQALCLSTLTLGMFEISLRVAQNKPAQLSLLFAGTRRLPAFWLLSALIGLLLFATQLLLAIPFAFGVFSLDDGWSVGSAGSFVLCVLFAIALAGYTALGVVFAALELVSEPTLGVIASLKNAWRIARGERLTIGFGLFVIGSLWLAGLMFCGVGAVFTLGYASVIFAALYLALRNGVTGLSR